MKRRDFMEMAAASALAAAGKPREWSGRRTPTGAKANLRLGTQHGDSDEILKVMAALGVNDICALPPTRSAVEDWSVEGLSRKREHIESFGIKAQALRWLYPSYITKSSIRNVL